MLSNAAALLPHTYYDARCYLAHRGVWSGPGWAGLVVLVGSGLVLVLVLVCVVVGGLGLVVVAIVPTVVVYDTTGESSRQERDIISERSSLDSSH